MAVLKSRGALTELEFCVLGAVWLRGPCSAYAIRREFAESTSSYWSSSAGSIYPVIKRLLAARMVAAKARPSDGRGKRDLVATARGVRVLRSWISELPEWTGMATLDPIRTRLNFFAVLRDVRARRAFVDRAKANTRAQIDALNGSLGKTSGAFDVERLATLGALYELEGRMRWLDAVRKALGRRAPVKSGRAASS